MTAQTSSLNTSTPDYDFRMYNAIQNLKKANIHYIAPLEGRDERMTSRRRAKEIARVIGERFACVRTDVGLTQAEIAAKAGLNVNTISGIENGRAGGFIGVMLYADALRLPLEVVFDGVMKDAVGQFTIHALKH